MRPITADNDEGIDIALAEKPYRRLLCLIGFEFRISLAAQDRPAALDDSSDVSKTQRKKVIAGQSGVAVANAEGFPALINCRPYNRPDSGVDSGSVSAAGYNGNLLRKVRLLSSP